MTVAQDLKGTSSVVSDDTILDMDNAAYRETENRPKKAAKEVRIPLENRQAPEPASTTPNPSAPKVCKPDVCRRARHRYQQAQGTESPWHRKKTYALVIGLVLFVIWIIIYVTLSELGYV